MISGLFSAPRLKKFYKWTSSVYRAMKVLPLREFLRRVYLYLGRVCLRLRGSIYPINIPGIEIRPDLDFLVMELPPRYMPLMPNGIGYVYNILKKTDFSFQVIDTNIIFYHRYHSRRILQKLDPVVTPGGYTMKEDPWLNTHTDEWERPEVVEYFRPQLEEILKGIEAVRPRVVGLSVHASNRTITGDFIKALRERMPDVPVVVGGYDCLYHDVGPHIFPHFDYMVIGEAELTMEPLLRALVRGERPKDVTGVVSRYDSPDRVWVEPPAFEDLDSAGYPDYEWTDISLYRTYEGGHLVPITASRGCRWSRCRFCAECLPFKKRSPKSVADEIEFMVSRGFHSFHFNESDVNGDPQNLYDICSEIIRRGLRAQFMGQLRIDRRNTEEYLTHLARAGFTHLRFGVDGWSDNVLRLQRKGYNMKMVHQNLRDCHRTGILVSANLVIGVPGETEEDVDEMIQNFARYKDYIYAVDSINTLILAARSEYYGNSDLYKIRFRGDRDEIYGKYPYVIPSSLWYSEEPYIDQDVRVRRMERICSALNEMGFIIAPFSLDLVEKLKKKDKAGSG